MLAEILFIAAAGIIDPMDMSGNYMYPSGVKECDKYPMYAPPKTNLAILTLPRDIYDSEGNIIKSGHYLISLSVSMDRILLFEGTKAIYTIPVKVIDYSEKYLKIETAEFYEEEETHGTILLKQGKLRIKANVYFADNEITN